MITLRFRAGIRKVALSALFGIPALFFSCDRMTPLPKSPPALSSVAPTRAELFIFPYGRLTMTAFESLRREFPAVVPEDLARMGMAIQWLQAKFGAKKPLPLAETTQCVRAIFNPGVSAADSAKSSAFAQAVLGFASLDLLRQSYRNAESQWVVDWNLALAQEYGISVPKP